MGWVKQEKQALVTTLRGADPSAPTLDEGWDVARLLSHLVVREQSPGAMIKDSRSKQPPGQEPELSKLVASTKTPGGYEALIDRFVAGPPAWSPMNWAAEKINLTEYIIHNEDIRRGGSEPAAPRSMPPGESAAVWSQLQLLARLSFRKSPVGVHLATPDGRHRVAKKGPGVTLTADPVELALYVSGRRKAAHVDISGPDEMIKRFRSWAATS